jgi:meso-butanediol dehydrogenase / (S,S)-butanediol dehydrogenase / diacetyl reductase
MNLSGRVVLLTGGTAGIGLACVRRMLSDGAQIHVVDLHATADREVLDALAAGRVIFTEADLGDTSTPAEMVQRTLTRWGRLDVLVNNAAYTAHRGGALLDTTDQEWQRQMDVTLRGTFGMCRAAVPAMLEGGKGSIVNVSSIGGVRPFANTLAYCTAKAAILQLTRSIAIDYGRNGIRCNAVCPGAIDTPAFSTIRSQPLELADREARTALGRIGTPEEVAAAVYFLASDEAAYITGITLTVDGGWDASQWNEHLGPRSGDRP